MVERNRKIARRLILLSGWKVRGALAPEHEQLIILVAPIRTTRETWRAILMAHAHPRMGRCFLPEDSMPRVLHGNSTMARSLRRALRVERLENRDAPSSTSSSARAPMSWDFYFMRPFSNADQDGGDQDDLIKQLCATSREHLVRISLHTIDAKRRIINIHTPFNPSGFPDRDKHYIVRQYEYY